MQRCGGKVWGRGAGPEEGRGGAGGASGGASGGGSGVCTSARGRESSESDPIGLLRPRAAWEPCKASKVLGVRSKRSSPNASAAPRSSFGAELLLPFLMPREVLLDDELRLAQGHGWIGGSGAATLAASSSGWWCGPISPMLHPKATEGLSLARATTSRRSCAARTSASGLRGLALPSPAEPGPASVMTSVGGSATCPPISTIHVIAIAPPAGSI